MYRSLQSRQIEASACTGIRTLEATHGIEPNQRVRQLAGLKVLFGEEEKTKKTGYPVKGNPFLYLTALEETLRTLTKAGTFWVDDPQDTRSLNEKALNPQRLMIERECIEEHIAKCRRFVLEWVTKTPPPRTDNVLRQLIRIDVTIRQKWVDLYRTNEPPGITFTACVQQIAPVADGLWTADLTQLIHLDGGKATGKGSKTENKLAHVEKQLKAEREKRKSPKGKDRGGSKGAEKSTKGKGKGVHPGGKLKLKDGRMAQLAKARGDKKFCPFYGRENSCRKEAGKCEGKHICAVMTAAGRICEQNHPSSDHTGAILQ